MTLLRIAIAGASGRMGRTLIETALNDPKVQLSGVLTRAESPLLGQDAGAFMGRETGILISDDPNAVLAQAECLIDFTRPDATMEYLKIAQRLGTKLVVGTTGWSQAQSTELQHAGKTLPIVLAPNMSIGVNILLKLIAQAAKLSPPEYETEIIEEHHRDKVDAPSGTALEMGKVIAQVRGVDFDKEAVFSREGSMQARRPNAIGFSSVRAGDIIGNHTALFVGPGERLEITHKSSNRYSYAQGALRAALFLEHQTSGLFDMQDVVGWDDTSANA